MANEINLIQRASVGNKNLAMLEITLQKVAWWSLGSLFVASIALGGAYFFLSSRSESVAATKADVTRQINQQSVKEGILLSLKERTTVATRALEAAKPWGNLFALLLELAPEYAYDSLSIDDVGRVSVVMDLNTIDDSVSIVAKAIELTGEKKLRTPQLLSLIVQDNGAVQMSLSFFPVL